MVNHCRCISKLPYEKQLEEVDRIYYSRLDIKGDTDKILIISKVKEARIGLNKIGFTIKSGLSITCLCKLKELKYNFDLKLSTYLLCVLEEVQCNIPKTQAFVLKGTSHDSDCESSKLLSLKELAYFSVFLNGYTYKDLKSLLNNHILPVTIYKEKPPYYVHLPFIGMHNLLNFYNPVVMHYDFTCKNPGQHLELHIGL